jgi:hypothetical protein
LINNLKLAQKKPGLSKKPNQKIVILSWHSLTANFASFGSTDFNIKKIVDFN